MASRLSLGGDGRRSSPAVRVAVAAVTLSVGVMIASVSVVMGFKEEITRKVTGFNSDISVTVVPQSADDSNLVTLTPTLRSILDTVPYVRGYALQSSAPAVLKTPDDFKGVYLKTCAGTGLKHFLAESLVAGHAVPAEGEVMMSQSTADALHLGVGDKIDTYFITDDVRVRRLKVGGIFNSHFESYDDLFVYGTESLINDIGGTTSDQGTVLSVDVDDFSRIHEYTQRLNSTLARGVAQGVLYKVYRAENAEMTGAHYFRWLDMLDVNVVVVLGLMTAVACVTLVSGMLIMIVDKKRVIALLRAMGASAHQTSRIFVLLALRVALTGTLTGTALGTGLMYAQKYTHFIHLDPDSYYMDFVPVSISWPLILLINIGVLAVAYIVLILPARFVGSINPAAELHQE